VVENCVWDEGSVGREWEVHVYSRWIGVPSANVGVGAEAGVAVLEADGIA
jgi:hypothetical protein